MEENRDEKKDMEEKTGGYTGEYGNYVEGDYQDDSQSVYRYSYKDGNGESTHSGDYYAQQNSQGTENTADTQGSGTENVEQKAQSDADGYQSTGSSYQQNGDYQSAGSGYQQNGGYQSTGSGYQQSGGYQSTGSGYQQSSGYQNTGSTNSNKPKKESSFGKKFLITVACAVVFGVVASVCFNAVNFAAERILGTKNETETIQLDKTTDNAVQATPAPDNSANNKTNTVTDVSAITEQSMPAVVAITSTTKGADYYDLFGQYYQGQDTTSCGSGFIVGQNDNELLIATNNHVIDGAKTISVQFIDGEIYEAKEKGSDSANDLAVIAVKTADVKKATMEQIKIADLGDSDSAKVGEMVIAIGNALGYGQSVTVGYISAKDREITESSDDGSAANKIKAIQTDAAINPGNSGGALLNMQGQVIGINSAKIAASEVEGVGYAIPISVAMPIIDELMNREELTDKERGYLGISGRTVGQEAVTYNIPYGVYVVEVAKDGAADKAGIQANDVITAINKMEVTTMESLQEKVNSYRKGTEIEITLQRSNNGAYEEKKVKVTLQGQESLDDLSDSTQGSGSSSDDSSKNDNSEKNYNDNNNNNNNPYGDNSGSFWDFFR